MSNEQMLDMCVQFLIKNHLLLTEKHVTMLNCLWNYRDNS